MNLREYLRNDFSKYIRARLIKEKCEYCGSSENLHFHHIDRFHNLLMETLRDLNLNEVDTELYSELDLNNIKYIMLGKQITSRYKTLCERCHKIVHYNEVKSKEYKEFYYNPFGSYFYINLKHDFFINKNILESDKLKFLYLCTFSDYNNNIVFGKSKNKKITQKDLFEIFKIFGRTANYKTIKVLFEEKALIEINGSIIINKSIIAKGYSNINCKNRLFENTIRYLIENNNSKSYKCIWNIIRLCEDIGADNTVWINGKNDNILISDILNFLEYKRYQTIKDMQNIKYNNEPILTMKNNKWAISKCLCYNGLLSRDFI